MSSKPPFVIPNPDFWFTLFTLILLTSFTPSPVNSRPSTSVDSPSHHPIHHEDAHTVPQQWEDMNNNSEEQVVTEINTLAEEAIQEEPEYVDNEPSYAEDYPLRDMPAAPMDDAADNPGGRKGEAKRSRSLRQGGKGGRRNDTDGIPQDLYPEMVNKTVGNGSAPNKTVNDSKASQQLMRHNQEIDHADSDKQERLKEIMQLVTIYRSQSSALSPSPTNGPNDGSVKLLNLNIFHPSPIDAYPMLSRSFHPSCSLPNNTNIKLWVDGDSMNLLFNLTYPAQQNTTVTIIAATLRLYKFSQGNHTLKAHSCKSAGVSSPNPDNDNDDGEQEPEKDTPAVPEAPELPATPGPVMADDDKQIRVSVYWYTQPLKKNKGKRKLLDSRMFPIYGKSGWVEFNVGSAAGQWYQPGKNFGLVVEVENEDGQLLKASDYFTAMNCSEASTARPLPGLLLQKAQSHLESTHGSAGPGLDISHIMANWRDSTHTNPITSNFPGNGRRKKETDQRDEDTPRRVTGSPYVYTFLFPVIDMCTVQVPAQEATNAAFVHHAQHLLTQLMAACRTTHMQNYADVILMHETQNYPTQTQPITEETNKTETTEVNNHNASPAHRQGHKKDQCRNILEAVRLAIPEELSPSMQDSLCSVKIRHLRHHLDEKHRPKNQTGNHKPESAMKIQVTNEENERVSEEIKEQVTWTDDNGREFKEKVTFEEVIRSASPLDSGVIPQRDSDR